MRAWLFFRARFVSNTAGVVGERGGERERGKINIEREAVRKRESVRESGREAERERRGERRRERERDRERERERIPKREQ